MCSPPLILSTGGSEALGIGGFCGEQGYREVRRSLLGAEAEDGLFKDLLFPCTHCFSLCTWGDSVRE